MNNSKKIFDYLTNKKVSAFLVTNPKNIFYLTGVGGFSENEREAFVLITHGSMYLITSRMHEEKTKKSRLPIINNQLLNIEILEVGERFTSRIKKLIGVSERVMFEEYDLKFSEYEAFKDKLSYELVSSDNFLLKQRQVKSKTEIESIKKAVMITDKTYDSLISYLKTSDRSNLTELDLIDFLQTSSRDHGGEGFGFDPIAASGEGSSEPHYIPTNKLLCKASHNEYHSLLIDIGLKFNGYSGDLSRTISLGEPSDEFRRYYNLVLECNELCLKMCKPGIDFTSIHKAAVTFFQKRGVDRNFIHSIGHSIGLDVHERIFPNDKKELLIQEGMVITIEPGLYFPGKYGIRIEDIVLVTGDGCEVLNEQGNKELIVL